MAVYAHTKLGMCTASYRLHTSLTEQACTLYTDSRVVMVPGIYTGRLSYIQQSGM